MKKYVHIVVCIWKEREREREKGKAKVKFLLLHKNGHR
jgi:hypothetical protein